MSLRLIISINAAPGKGAEFEGKFFAVLEAMKGIDGHKESFLYKRVDDPDSYVGAALSLFASVALMFWYVIRILMKLRE